MNVCTRQQMQQAERRLIESGQSALDLMSDAAARIASSIMAYYPVPGHCVGYVGKGNNGGDAVAVLNILQRHGWKVSARCAYPSGEWCDPLRHQWQQSAGIAALESPCQPAPGEQVLLLDGLLGLGGQLPLNPEIEELCREMNSLRSSIGSVRTWAIDLPTGIDPDRGYEPGTIAVTADYTSVIGAVKAGLLDDATTAFVGRLVSISMPGLEVESSGDAYLLEPKLFARLLRPRPYAMYKNQAGHVGVIAGSVGMLGAAKLCSEAALKAGAGLVTLHCPHDVYPVLAAMVTPEVMVRPVGSYDDCAIDTFDAMLIGPGLGSLSRQTAASIGVILRNFEGPIVLDADGLNLVASERIFLRENVLATPHPGEMGRFLPQSAKQLSRAEIAVYFTQKHAAALVYKGARSIVTQADAPLYYNSTGGPAMATAGQGDVLAGVCAGLCAQKVTPLMAGCLGTHLCGLASDLELSAGRQTEKSLMAGDTLRALPKAMQATASGIL